MNNTAATGAAGRVLRAVMAAWLLSAPASSALAQEVPRDIRDVIGALNEDKVPLNDGLLVLGSPAAKVTAVLFYAQACTDTERFWENVYPDLKKDFLDSGKLRLVLYEYPLNWKDIQAQAGLRCVPKEKHLDALLEAARTRRAAIFRRTTAGNVPDQFVSVLTKFGLTQEQALKCMRNTETIGFVEGQRRLAVEQWNIVDTPTLLIGEQLFRGIDVKGVMYDVLKKFVQ